MPKKFYTTVTVDHVAGHASLVTPGCIDDDVRTLLVCSCDWEQAFDSAPSLSELINVWYAHLATVPAGSPAPHPEHA